MKFVIHYHETQPDHYDLMIEKGDSLATWQIMSNRLDSFLKGDIIESCRIDDHKKKYLSYEGEISCDRGRVKLYDSGEYSLINWDDNYIELSINGNILNGSLIINTSNDNYTIKYKKIS